MVVFAGVSDAAAGVIELDVVFATKVENVVPIVVPYTGSIGGPILVVIDLPCDVVVVLSSPVVVAKESPGQTVLLVSLKVTQAVFPDVLSLVGLPDGQYTEKAWPTEELEVEPDLTA